MDSDRDLDSESKKKLNHAHFAMRLREKELREKRQSREKELNEKRQSREKELREKRRSGIPSPESSLRGTGRHHWRSEHAAQTRVRQSSMYSDRPRRSRGRRAEPQTNLPAAEVAAEGCTNELGPTIADMSNLKRLSLNDSSSALDLSYGDVVNAADMGSGLPDSTVLVSSPAVQALSPRLEKYLKEHSFDTFEDACAYLCTPENTAIIRIAVAEDNSYEDRSVQALEQGTPAAAQHSKASKEDIVQNGKKWMTEEVKVAFEKYMEGKDHLKDHMYEFDELQQQCFSVENYHKIFHHFNFTMKMKAPGSMEWTSMLFFAEVKEILRQKMYFCCPLEPYENGHCYACKNQGMDDLKHPLIGAFDRGSPDTVFPYIYESDSSDDGFAPVRLEDEAEDESYVFDDER